MAKLRAAAGAAALAIVALGAVRPASAATLVTFTGVLDGTFIGTNELDNLGLFGPAGASLAGASVTLRMVLSDPGFFVPGQTGAAGESHSAILRSSVTINGHTADCATIAMCSPEEGDWVASSAGSFDFFQVTDSANDLGQPDVQLASYFLMDVTMEGTHGPFGVADASDLSTYSGRTFTSDPNFIFGDFFFGVHDVDPDGGDLVEGTYVGGGLSRGTVSFQTVPEPAAWALMIAGFGLAGAALRRRRAAAATY